ncbi:MFS transporter [bacterium]|nr:MFS transporter [bacterium]MCB9475436.1 MFS transporter [Deltaproteobacteria bacterium]
MKRKIVLLLGSSMTVMAGATIAPSLPAMRDIFQDTPGAGTLVPLLLTVPALMIALTSPGIGWLVDRYGRKPILLIALVLYAAAGTSGLYLNSLSSLLVGRALLGVAVAGTMTSVMTLVADYYKGEERQAFMGHQSSFMSFGGIVFLTTGGFLADGHWRWPFALYFASLLLWPFAATALVEPRFHADHSHDPSLLDFPIHWPSLIFLYATAMAGMLLFYLIPVQMPFFLKQKLDVAPKFMGLIMATANMASALVSSQYFRLRRYFTHQAVFAFLFFFVGAGFTVLSRATEVWQAVAAMLICGVGFGMLIPNINVCLAAVSPEKVRGRLFGGLMTCVFLGQFISPIAASPVAHRTGLDGVFGVYGIASLEGLVVSAGFVLWMLSGKARFRTPSPQAVVEENP